MSDPLKPKRGFVYATNEDAPLAVWPDNPHGNLMIPVLVVPEPDREPTHEEVEELARKLFPSGNGCSVSGITPGAREVARAAFRLGARVQP